MTKHHALVAFDELPSLVGKVAYESDWMAIDAEHLQMFGKSCYLDPAHVDLTFSKNNAFGSNLVDGFLILSMLVFWNFKDFPMRDEKGWGLNYGLNKVRWMTPVMMGDNLRAICRVTEMKPRGEGWLGTLDITVEKEGADKPAMKAEWICLFLRGDHA